MSLSRTPTIKPSLQGHIPPSFWVRYHGVHTTVLTSQPNWMILSSVSTIEKSSLAKHSYNFVLKMSQNRQSYRPGQTCSYWQVICGLWCVQVLRGNYLFSLWRMDKIARKLNFSCKRWWHISHILLEQKIVSQSVKEWVWDSPLTGAQFWFNQGQISQAIFQSVADKKYMHPNIAF